MVTLRHIVVGVDGSANARAALAWAVALARPVGARITAVHALGLLERIDGEPIPTATHREEIAESFAARWCAALDDAGVPSDRLLVDGPPADVILAAAAERDADLVIVGERGAGSAIDLGSTSRRVLEGARRPVLVVPLGSPS